MRAALAARNADRALLFSKETGPEATHDHRLPSRHSTQGSALKRPRSALAGAIGPKVPAASGFNAAFPAADPSVGRRRSTRTKPVQGTSQVMDDLDSFRPKRLGQGVRQSRSGTARLQTRPSSAALTCALHEERNARSESRTVGKFANSKEREQWSPATIAKHPWKTRTGLVSRISGDRCLKLLSR